MSNFNLSTVHLLYPEKHPVIRFQLINTNTNTEHIICCHNSPRYLHISTLQNFKLCIGQELYSTIILAEHITGNEVLTYFKLLQEIEINYPIQALKVLYNLLRLDYEEI